MKCAHCNKMIKNPYTYQGQVFGIECWKKIALPAILEQKRRVEQECKEAQYAEDFSIAFALERKDVSRIESDFKLNFIGDVSRFFQEKGYITTGQKKVIFGTGYYNRGIFNDKDCVNIEIAKYALSSDDEEKEAILDFVERCFPRHLKYFQANVGEEVAGKQPA